MAIGKTVEELIIEANLRGDATLKVRDLERAVDRFGRKGSQDLQKVTTSAKGTSNAFRLVAASGGAMIAGLVSAAAVISGVEVAFRAATGEGRRMLDVTATAESTASRFVNAFGSQSGGAVAALDEFGNAAGRATSELASYAARFKGILDTIGLASDDATGLAIELTKRAVDLGSRFDIADSDALVALASGLVGEAEPMRRFNVLLSETAVKAEAYASGIAAVGAELTEQEKVQARANIILRQSAVVQDDAINTADEWSNRLKALNAEITELREKFGKALREEILDTIEKMGGSTTVTDALTVAIGSTEVALKGLVRLSGSVLGFGAQLIDAFGGPAKVISELGFAVDALSHGIEIFEVKLQKLSARMLPGFLPLVASDPSDVTQSALDDLTEKEEAIGKKLWDQFTERRKWLTDFAADVEKLAAALRGEQQENSGKPKKLTVTAAAPGFWEGFKSQLEDASKALGDLHDAGEKAAATLARGFQSAISDYIVALAEGTAATEEFGQALLRTIARMFADVASGIFTSALTSAIAGVGGKGGGSSTGAGGFTSGGATGGYIPGFPTGGYVDPRDTRLARVSPGEVILDPQDVRRAGLANLMNFRHGGALMGTGGGGARTINAPISVTFNGDTGSRQSREEAARMIRQAVIDGLRGADRQLQVAVRGVV